MLAYLRARALSRGFLGGSRFWIGLGAVVWTIRLCQWLVRPETEVIYREPLGRGESVVIRHADPLPTRKQRKQAKKQAKKTDRKTAKRAQKQARKTKGSPEAIAA